MIRRVLIIGSGPIVIGQAAEFDYAGTQACLACRAAGVSVILVNSNPATIQTDAHVADTVYIEPLTVASLEAIIARERPDGLIATVGGQTALNLAVALEEQGVLQRYGVSILGTSLQAVRRGEDRALFAQTLKDVGEPVLPSHAVTSVEAALAAAEAIGYPVMCRSAFALGGAGSGFARNEEELAHRAGAGLRASGSGQVLIERSVYGWTEAEYEVVRDAMGNSVVVCNMENIDPMGVHTGDSIVVAPSQTLTDQEYHTLRRSAITVVDALGVVGACNVQFALDRETGQHYVIEVNPRLSRSSALASKATGYPIAKVATQIALGKTLPDIWNDITGTSAFFEPALDYVVVKIPRWPYDKFTELDGSIGTSMRSTGEVMAIGRTFVEAMDKAIRGTEAGARAARGDLEPVLTQPNGYRLPAILDALRQGWSSERVAELTRIHPWFIDRLSQVAAGTAQGPRSYHMVDTCAAEFEARTPYFYSSTIPGERNEAESLPGPKAIILGSGPIRIGQGIEFDYATVHACTALSSAGVRSIIVNNNPETVSTDYSTSDRLYFEPLDLEAVMAVVENERDGLMGVVPQFGGQTAINLAGPLHELGVPILGTPAGCIDTAEDRARASALFVNCSIPIPSWRAVHQWEDVLDAVRAVGFPAQLRPSYVLSGRGMVLVRSEADVRQYLREHDTAPLTHPLLVDHFLDNTVELNVDAVSDGRQTVSVVLEQFEECGVHSGDSAEVYPPQSVSAKALATVNRFTSTIAQAFGVVGLMNVQFAVRGDDVFVLEVNPRASRSVPFASKASGIPLTDLAIRAILGDHITQPCAGRATGAVAVKEVVFPFRAFPGLTPVLGPEMQSTGESMGVGSTFAEAYWKAQQGAGMSRLPFGTRVVVARGSIDPAALDRLQHALQATSSTIDLCEAEEADAPRLGCGGMAIVLGRTDADLALLRQCVDMGVPYISTKGGVRALTLALEEGRIELTPIRMDGVGASSDTGVAVAAPAVPTSPRAACNLG